MSLLALIIEIWLIIRICQAYRGNLVRKTKWTSWSPVIASFHNSYAHNCSFPTSPQPQGTWECRHAFLPARQGPLLPSHHLPSSCSSEGCDHLLSGTPPPQGHKFAFALAHEIGDAIQRPPQKHLLLQPAHFSHSSVTTRNLLPKTTLFKHFATFHTTKSFIYFSAILW